MTEAEIGGWLRRWLGARTGRGELAAGVSLASLGLGSREAVELAADLSEKLGFEVSATAAWDHPTLEALARHLAGAADAPRDSAEQAAAPAGGAPIAVVGLACRVPGADSAEALWELLAQGRDAITAVPPERAELARVARWGGFLGDVSRFDAAFFGISGREAAAMDPQQRLLLELAWEALEDAAIPPRGLAGTPVGVFVGIAASDYGRLLLADPERADQYAGTGNALSIAANRISYVLDLNGPSLAVDTACSSSLVAVHLACRSLARGESTLAIVGGANVLLDGAVTESFARAGFMAPDGRCRAFAADASGYVRAEGAGVVVLAPLAVAQAAGWPVRALIIGSAVNQDGRSNGLTAPSRRSQEAVLAAAHADARIAGGDVQYVEAHGTGTPLGDPIEALALGRALAAGRAPRDRCLVGSIKTNIGHLEAAAGIAGLIKCVLALERAQVPPSLHFDRPSPHIPFADLALEVPVALTAWPAHRGPARAGVSAFGFGGTNAHVVLERAPERAAEDAAAPGRAATPEGAAALGGAARAPECGSPVAGRALLAVSAASAAALGARARALADWLVGAGGAVPLADVAHTLARRRSALEHRLAVVGATAEELAAALRAMRGPGDDDRSALAEAARAFTAGDAVDLAAHVGPGRAVRLPAYPWQRERHWTELAPARGLSGGHPWLGRGVASSLRPGEWLFDVELSPRRDAWLRDHRVAASAVLPLAAHVELGWAAARAAGRPTALAGLAVERALPLPDEIVRLQTAVAADGAVLVSHATERGFVPLARARLEAPAPPGAQAAGALDRARARCATPVEPRALYARLAALGLSYGPAFQRVSALRQGDGEAVAELAAQPGDARWVVHPAVLDAAFHALAAAAPAGAALAVPVGAARAELFSAQPPAWAHAVLRGLTGQIALYAADGAVVAAIEDLALRPLAERAGPRWYRTVWRPVAAAPPRVPAGRWLIVPDRGGQALALAAAVERRGGRARVASGLGPVGGEPADVVADLRALDAGPDGAAHALACCTGSLALLQGIAAGRVLVAARGLAAGALAGLVSTFAAEQPGVPVALVDLEGDATALLDAPSGEERLTRTSAGWRAARLEEISAGHAALALDPDATYLITGGMGALGLHAARALAAGGARHLVLAGRHIHADTAAALEAELAARGADARTLGGGDAAARAAATAGGGVTVDARALDVGDAAAVEALVGELARGRHALRGIFHAAGALADGTLARQSAETFAVAFRGKALGAWNLHRATQALALDHFVLFSSVAGVLGSPGQASYAAANAFLDALALSRRQGGRAALSIAWGPWAGGGLAVGAGARLAASGFAPIEAAAGRAALASLAAGSGEACVAVLDVRWGELAARLPRRPALLAEVAPAEAAAPALAAALGAAPPAERPALLLAHLQRQAATVLGAPGEKLETDVPLLDLGLDSLVVLELQQWLERALGTPVPGSHFLGNPTLEGLAASLLAGRPDDTPVDLRAEVQLDPRVTGGAPARAEPPRRVLLTGASGYLGAYLLHDLLRRPGLHVDCLVRGDTGPARIAANLARYELWCPTAAERVRAVTGDLAAPGLGLGARAWDELAAEVDVVIHAGAWVNFAYAYPVLKAANVGGTAELLRLASTGRTRPFHHVSTLGMLLSTAHPPGARVSEETADLPCWGLANGYEQSKWVADGLVALARARGVPASIHRVGLLTGESGTGAYVKRDDFFPAWLKGCIQLGCMPALATLTELVPVDYASRLIVALALSGAGPRTYHVTHPAPVPLAELARAVVEAGFPLELVPFDAWKARLGGALARGAPNALGPHRHFVELLEEQQSVFPRLANTHARAAAAQLSIDCPPVPELVARYLAYFRATGFL